MNYYLDQEFNEYFKKLIWWLPSVGSFNRRYHTIELISIGIVAEDGREYYAVCNEFNVRAAYNKYQVEKSRNYGDSRNISEYTYTKKYWLRDNVLSPIFFAFYKPTLTNLHHVYDISLSKMKDVIKANGKSKKEIMYEVNNFICSLETASEWADVGPLYYGFSAYLKENPPVFYGYYADYDWVCFCSLYGTMMDLPEGFPMYCIDLKQTLDEKAMRGAKLRLSRAVLDSSEAVQSFINTNFEAILSAFKNMKSYPSQIQEHHALADALWIKKLHEFLKNLK